MQAFIWVIRVRILATENSFSVKNRTKIWIKPRRGWKRFHMLPFYAISMPSYLPRFETISLPCLHCVPFQCQDLMQPIVYHFNAKLFAKIWYNPLFTISLQSHLPRFDTIHCLPFQCHLIWCKILPCLGHLGMLTLIFSIGCVPMVGLRSKYILL